MQYDLIDERCDASGLGKRSLSGQLKECISSRDCVCLRLALPSVVMVHRRSRTLVLLRAAQLKKTERRIQRLREPVRRGYTRTAYLIINNECTIEVI